MPSREAFPGFSRGPARKAWLVLLIGALCGPSLTAARPQQTPSTGLIMISTETGTPQEKPDPSAPRTEAALEVATFGAGCFWCVEAVLQQVDGVKSVISGYMGGHVKDPTYEQICTKKTGHAEVVQVTFDPKKLSYEHLLAWFWKLHDPTTLNRQGNDEGPQYRSVIFFHSDAQKATAEKSKAALEASDAHKSPIVTEITKAATFYKAEADHQDYYRQNKSKNPYCPAVISPKLKKLGLKF